MLNIFFPKLMQVMVFSVHFLYVPIAIVNSLTHSVPDMSFLPWNPVRELFSNHYLTILNSFGIFPNYNCHFTDRLFSDTPFLRRHSVTEVLQMQCNWSTLSIAFVFSNPPSQFSSKAQFLSETSLSFGTI